MTLLGSELPRRDLLELRTQIPPVGSSAPLPWYSSILDELERRGLLTASLVETVASRHANVGTELLASFRRGLEGTERDAAGPSRLERSPQARPKASPCPPWQQRLDAEQREVLTVILDRFDEAPPRAPVRVVCIIGDLGSGRTRVAQEYVRRFGYLYDRCLYVDCAQGRTPHETAEERAVWRLLAERDAASSPDDEKETTPGDAAQVLEEILADPRRRVLVTLDGMTDLSLAEVLVSPGATLDVLALGTIASSRCDPVQLAPLSVSQQVEVLLSERGDRWTLEARERAQRLVESIGGQPALLAILSPLMALYTPEELHQALCVSQLPPPPCHPIPGLRTELVDAAIRLVHRSGCGTALERWTRWCEQIRRRIAVARRLSGETSDGLVPRWLRLFAWLAPDQAMDRELLWRLYDRLDQGRGAAVDDCARRRELEAIRNVGLLRMEADLRPSVSPLVQVALRELAGAHGLADARALLNALAQELPIQPGDPAWSSETARGRYGALLPHLQVTAWRSTSLPQQVQTCHRREMLHVALTVIAQLKQEGRSTAAACLAEAVLGTDGDGDARWASSDWFETSLILGQAGQAVLRGGLSPSRSPAATWFARERAVLQRAPPEDSRLEKRRCDAHYWHLVERVQETTSLAELRSATAELDHQAAGYRRCDTAEIYVAAIALARTATSHARLADWEATLEMREAELLEALRRLEEAFATLADVHRTRSLVFASLLQIEARLLRVLYHQRLRDHGALERAALRLREAIRLCEQRGNTHHPVHADALRLLALVEADLGHDGEARRNADLAEELNRQGSSEGQGALLSSQVAAMVRLMAAVRAPLADEYPVLVSCAEGKLRAALRGVGRAGSPRDQHILTFLLHVARYLRNPGDRERAELHEALDRLSASWGPFSVETTSCGALLRDLLHTHPPESEQC